MALRWTLDIVLSLAAIGWPLFVSVAFSMVTTSLSLDEIESWLDPTSGAELDGSGNTRSAQDSESPSEEGQSPDNDDMVEKKYGKNITAQATHHF